MKAIILFLLIILSSPINAQIGFEKTIIDGSGLIDFPIGTTKGIVLPQVADNTNMTDVSEGTFIFDGATSRVKYYNGIIWIELTGQTGTSRTLLPGAENNQSKGIIIGASDSDAKGVLILESQDKALILPKIIDPATNVKSPSPGMMCYDPVLKLVCFYNGTSWAFWGNID